MLVARNTKMNKIDTYSHGICMLDEKMESQFNIDSMRGRILRLRVKESSLVQVSLAGHQRRRPLRRKGKAECS